MSLSALATVGLSWLCRKRDAFRTTPPCKRYASLVKARPQYLWSQRSWRRMACRMLHNRTDLFDFGQNSAEISPNLAEIAPEQTNSRTNGADFGFAHVWSHSGQSWLQSDRVWPDTAWSRPRLRQFRQIWAVSGEHRPASPEVVWASFRNDH